jgi:hypothetical protein
MDPLLLFAMSVAAPIQGNHKKNFLQWKKAKAYE